MSGSSRRLDRFATTFDHEGLVANAGLILAGTLMARLGLLALIERWVRTGSANPGPKICTVVAAMLAGGHSYRSCRDAARRTHREGAGIHARWRPRRSGRCLRTFTFGHVRQLEAVLSRTLGARLGAGRRPGRRAAGGRSGLHDLRGPRQTKTRRRVRPTPKSSAVTRCSLHAPTPARCSAPACAKGPRGPREAWCASSTSSSRTCDAPGLPGRPRCAPTRDSGPAN